jgi:hypothetical protein
MDDATIWYEVPCGIPLPNIEDAADVQRRLSAAAIPERARLPMMRAWCPICVQWKEPLLAEDGLTPIADPVGD